MKTPIAITLIVMGALLVMLPAFADMVYQHNLVTLMTSQAGATTASIDGKMSDTYHFGCWATGSGMVIIAVLSVLRGAKTQPAAHPAGFASREA
ncbi:hypothetical protein [Haloferula sp. BvORR071]|uniref:hypothetical protein n=1 Tax=Haloferula sp. BvORR071 TaxID=1396141 RepID=UPI0005531356|nr:hypothetical protein [Haloferula sp. BvORR071]